MTIAYQHPTNSRPSSSDRSTPYGPRQSARAVIPTIITQIAAGKRRIALGALSPTRDFSFVTDTAEGLVCGLTAPDAAVGRTLNLGSGFELSIGDTAQLIARVMGVEIEIATQEDRLRPAGSEVERLWADNRLAADLLGWTPRFGGAKGLEKGLAITAEWFRDPGNLARYKTDIYVI